MLIKNHPKSIWRKIDDLQKFVSIRCCHSLKSDLESIVISLYFRTKLCTYTETLKVILILQNHIFPKNEKKNHERGDNVIWFDRIKDHHYFFACRIVKISRNQMIWSSDATLFKSTILQSRLKSLCFSICDLTEQYMYVGYFCHFLEL